MTQIIDRTRATSRPLIKITVLLVLALLGLALTGCRSNSTETEPVAGPVPSSLYAPLGDPSGYPDEYGEYSDDSGSYGDQYGAYPYDPGYTYDPAYPDEPDYTDPGSTTNPCAFPGDPLCPDTPITVPPPQLDPPF